MNISYYTIDDLRLPPKRSLRRGRSVEQYSTLEEALARYQSLPAAGIRVLGLTDGIHVLDLLPGSECWGSQTESMSWSW